MNMPVDAGSGGERITILEPDDWHVHLRDDHMLEAVIGWTARQFRRALVMPNLVRPIVSSQDAIDYRRRILTALPRNSTFEPLMTVYLTDQTGPEDIETGYAEKIVRACKLYPAHATTNSEQGVTDIKAIYPVLERMQRIGMPLLIHGEVTDDDVDIFDREAVFIDRVLQPTLREFPALKVVFEHITTAEAVDFVNDAPPSVAATITPHHLQINRNAMFAGGIRPHLYCLPVAKRERHRLALRRAAVSGSAKFFLGTDSAPHPASAKESACGCAGIFNAPVAMESYATVFDEEMSLDRLEAFASHHGADFYGLPRNGRRVQLVREELAVPTAIDAGEQQLVPFHAGALMTWRFIGAID